MTGISMGICEPTGAILTGILSGEIFFAEAAFCSVGAGAGSLPGLGQQPPSRGTVATDLADSDFLRVAMVLHLVAAARRRQDAASGTKPDR